MEMIDNGVPEICLFQLNDIKALWHASSNMQIHKSTVYQYPIKLLGKYSRIDSQVYLDLIKDHIVSGLHRSFQQQQNGAFAECGICRMVILLTVPYLFAITCNSCLAIVWLEWDIRLIGQPEVQISLHWTSIYGVQSSREFTDKALLPVFDSCGIASLMPSTRSDAPER